MVKAWDCGFGNNPKIYAG